MRTSHEFSPNFLRLVPTKQRLTSTAGLGTLLEGFNESPLSTLFARALPEREVRGKGQGAYRLGLTQIASFLQGHDCLADLDQFRKDPSLVEVMNGETAAPRTMGDFLRDFEPENLSKLNIFLATQAKSYRVQLEKMLKKQFKPSLAPRLNIDSTSHVQRGKKMEGLAYNYKDEWCLDSQVIFDELGFCWDMELRPGNTKSGVGAGAQIRRAFSAYKFKDEKYLSGDAAYCNQEVITTCLSEGAKFSLTANQATTGWESHISEITTWTPWKWSPEQLQAAAQAEIRLPEIDLGYFYWRPSWNETLCFPVVVKRTKRTDQLSLLDGEWKYYGVVSNLNLAKMALQEVIEFHNKRGNAENFIREEKYGYDLKHFPCLELKANHAYGLIAMVAHNILRWVSIHENPSRPRFAKGIRARYIHVPGKVVSHARTLVLKVSEHFIEEVNRLRQALELKPYPLIPMASP